MTSIPHMFSNQRRPAVRADNPGLKLSQLREKLFKVWQKHPENPLVIAAAEKAAVALAGKAAAR